MDKPAGMTSHDVVSAARRALRERRIGHLGTLDPFASGLLVLLVGRATRLATHVPGEPKVYDALIRFGSETDTDDRTGLPTREAPLPDPKRVRAAVLELTGSVSQLPPAYSAKRVAGERSYAAAREGRVLALQPVTVQVQEWVVHELDAQHARVTIRCGGGTYIRALARDLGRLCHSAAHLVELRRTASGPFPVSDALPFVELDSAARRLRPMLDALPHLPRRWLSSDERRRVLHGNPVPAGQEGAWAALVDERGDLVAVAQDDRGAWQPRVVLQDG